MKRHALFLATALVVSFGAASLASAQTAAPAQPQRATAEAARDGGERPARWQGKGPRGGHHAGGIARLDTDGDGRISRAELEQAHAARSARMAGKGKPRGGGGGGGGGRDMLSQFDAIDANRDGYLVRTELRAWHERQRPQREAERAQRFEARFVEADLNRDGRLSRLEVDEKMPRLATSFAWMDDSRDGFLSRAELQAGKPQGGVRR